MKVNRIAAAPMFWRGKEPHRRMNHEVADRHLARKDEGDGPREQADEQQTAADQFQNAGHEYDGHHLGWRRRHGRGREVEEDLDAGLDEQKRGDDAQRGPRLRGIRVELHAHGGRALGNLVGGNNR